jgi:FMN reductase
VLCEDRLVAVTVVCGNPKPASRTLTAAVDVATRIADGTPPTTVIDLVDLGPALLGWGDPAVTAAVEAVGASDVVVVASPTYKASFTGLLKLFLDQIAGDSLRGVIGIPLMLGAGPAHALAAEVHLRPVLVELGLSCPTRALYLLDTETDGPALDAWLEASIPIIRRLWDPAGADRKAD